MTGQTESLTHGDVLPERRSVVITGGNSGIGLAIGEALGADGWTVVLWGRNEEKNATALERLRTAEIDGHAVTCDVSDPTAVAAAWNRSEMLSGGRIHAMFANAGRGSDAADPLTVSLDDWRDVMAVNLDGAFHTMQTAARHMVVHGSGALVAVSSTSAVHGAPRNLAYSASKAALLAVVRGLAVGLARHRIRVNALLPGWTMTDLASDAHENERFRTVTTQRTPVRRWAQPKEMAPAARFLADPDALFHTGDCVVVDGGYTIQ